MDHQFNYNYRNFPSNNFSTTFGYNSNEMENDTNLFGSNDYKNQLDKGLELVNNILKENIGIKNTNNRLGSNYTFQNNKNMNSYEAIKDVMPSTKILNKENLNPDIRLPVESRLNMINEVYKMRRDERAQMEYRSQQECIKSPQINSYSKELVESKYSNHRKTRANERLYEDHRKRQIAQDMKQKLLEKQAKAMAQPNLTNKDLGSPYNVSQCFVTSDGKQIVSRLLDYKHKYAENEVQLKVKYDDKECTFQPKINNNSK